MKQDIDGTQRDLNGRRGRLQTFERLLAQPDEIEQGYACLLYTSDAADERSSVDLGGRRIIKKKTTQQTGRRELRHRHNIPHKHKG